MTTFLLIAAGALLVPGPPRRLALLGLVPLGLGIAATTVRLGDDLSQLALHAAERAAPLRFLQINTGLVLLGLGLIVTAAAMPMVRPDSKPGRVISILAAILVAAGAVPILSAHLPVLALIGWLPSLGAAAGIGAVVASLFALGRLLRIGPALGWIDTSILERNPPSLLPEGNTTFDLVWVSGFFVSGLILLITPSLRAFSLAVVVVGTVSHVLMRRAGGGSTIPVTALLSLLVIPVYQSFAAVAGEPAPPIGTLSAQPLSIAAESRIVPWLALVGWGLAGLWPLHGLTFPLAAPIAGIVLIRLGAHALPNGMAHWSPVFMPLALLGIWHGAGFPGDGASKHRRWIELLVGLSLFGIFAGGDGVVGAYWLLSAAVLLPWTGFLFQPGIAGGLGRLFGLPVVSGAFLVVTGGLATQVVYTTLAVLGIAVAIWVYHTPE